MLNSYVISLRMCVLLSGKGVLSTAASDSSSHCAVARSASGSSGKESRAYLVRSVEVLSPHLGFSTKIRTVYCAKSGLKVPHQIKPTGMIPTEGSWNVVNI